VDMLGRSLPVIRVADVGASWSEKEPTPYSALVRSGAATVIGFDALQEECDRLNARGMRNHTFHPYAIGDGSLRTFHRCAFFMCSSLYPPNMPLAERFEGYPELVKVVGTSPVQTRRLDDIPEIGSIDFLKMDVQGAELDVLKGGGRTLRDAVAVQLEVEFHPLYTGQPLFADLDAELRRMGLVLHFFPGMSGRTFRPIVNAENPYAPLRQILWAEAVYVRDFMRLAELQPPSLLKMAVILHDVYDSYDLAALCLQHHDAATGGSLWTAYMQRMLGSVPPKPPLP
jgi:FkbM family methyltransferase